MDDLYIKYEYYLGSLNSILDEILANDFNLENVKKTYFPHAFAKINQFSESNYIESDRIEFVDSIFQMIDEVELKLSDLKLRNSDERIEALIHIKAKVKSIFTDINIDSKKSLTTNEKVIILEYLGVFKFFDDNKITQKNQAQILELLLEKSFDNIKQSISGRNGKIKKTGSVRNEISLNNVKRVADKLNFTKLIDKVDEDLIKLNISK